MNPAPPESPTLFSLPALQRGDADAWRALFETYGEPLYRYAYHRLGDPVLAEDVRQETFLSAIQNIDQFRGEAPLFGWLCGIARYKSLNVVSRRAREGDFLPERGEDLDEGADLPDPAALAPEDCVVTGEQRAVVIEALWSLPEDYRQSLVWRYARGEAVDRIAERMGRSYKSVESLLSRARAALREQMEAAQRREEAGLTAAPRVLERIKHARK